MAAMMMGLAATLLFGESPVFAYYAAQVVSVVSSVGLFLYLPIAFFAMAAGVASLRKDGKGWTFSWTTLVWSIVTALLLSGAASVIFKLYPVLFPATSSAGASSFYHSIGFFFSNGSPAAITILLASTAALILGYFLKPDADVIRPAYVVANSFSEVVFRYARALTSVCFVLIFMFSTVWFTKLLQDGTIFVAARFLTLILGGTLIALLAVLPLIYGIFTGFSRNPYRVIYRLTAPALMALFSGNSGYSWSLLSSTVRQNVGVQKRIVGTAAPLYILLGRAGTSFIAVLVTSSLLYAATGSVPSYSIVLSFAMACCLTGFVSGLNPGMEILAVVIFSLKIFGIELHGGEAALLAFLPLLNGLGLMLDTVVSAMGMDVTATRMETAITVDYEDIL